MRTARTTLGALAVALAATAGSGFSASAARQAPVRECGDVDPMGVGIKNLTTRGVTCRRARRVARRHPQDETPFGYRCRSRDLAQYEYDIRCTRGARVVRWQYVSD